MSGPNMSLKIDEIMKSRVITVTPHQTAGHVRELLEKNKINIVPVVGPEREVLGVVSSADLIKKVSDNKPVGQFMTEKIYTIPRYGDVELAARMMRKHKIHHLVVIDDKKLAGVISSFDLLQLLEGKRFVIKNAPTQSKATGKRSKAES
ncbi:MAG: CBS domain-containing protein [Leptospiraceae bacterium]